MIATRDDIAWLSETERRVILPLKWVLFVLCAVYWLWDRNWQPPSIAAFGLFVGFFWLLLGQHYFFARDRITPAQLRPFLLGLFVIDLGFLGALISLDLIDRTVQSPVVRLSSYTPLFLLAALRGIALFRTRTENILGFLLIVAVFALTSVIQLSEALLLDYLTLVRQLALMAGALLIVQAFALLLNARIQDMLASRERQVRSESLASLGELSAGIAHEINNPIGIIKTYVDFLDRSVKEEDPLREDFATIRREADRCQEIVRRMLDFSNPQTTGMQPVTLRPLVEEVVSFVFHEGDAGRFSITISEKEPSAPPVLGDPAQLRQALLNVLLNARQLFEDTHADDREPGRIEIELTRGPGLRPPVRLIVNDNGPGLTAEEAKRAFEPFFTKRAKGTGLGLAITQRIIEAHGGTIRIQPRPLGGAAVTIDLPMIGEDRP